MCKRGWPYERERGGKKIVLIYPSLSEQSQARNVLLMKLCGRRHSDWEASNPPYDLWLHKFSQRIVLLFLFLKYCQSLVLGKSHGQHFQFLFSAWQKGGHSLTIYLYYDDILLSERHLNCDYCSKCTVFFQILTNFFSDTRCLNYSSSSVSLLPQPLLT